MPELSNERLADIRNEYAGLRDGLPSNLPDASGAASAFYLSLSLGEVVSMATELQQHRASVVTPEMVERAGVAIWDSLVGPGIRLTRDDIANYSAAAQDALTAALSVVSHETWDGETEQPAEAGADRWPLAEAMKTAETWIQEYDLDDGESYHVPTETERLLMLDMVTGLFSDDEFIAILRRTFASPLPAPTDETQGVKREPSQLEAVERSVAYLADQLETVLDQLSASDARAETAEASLAAMRGALTPALVRKLETYLSIFDGDKELRSMIWRIRAALAAGGNPHDQ